MRSWTEIVMSKRIPQIECKEEAREFGEVKYKVLNAEYNHRLSEYITEGFSADLAVDAASRIAMGTRYSPTALA